MSGLLALGADPASAWASTEAVPALAAFARAAVRSAATGAALAYVAAAEAERLRADLLDSAQARAQRAAVLITGPLGLCFLPAFLVLGIAPVVIVWVPRTVSRPLISAFAASRPRSHSSRAAQHDRSPWLSDSRTWRSPAC